MTDLYSILGIDSDATKSQIRKAYKSKAQEYHPDKNKGDEKKAELFRLSKEAFDVLSDSFKRKEYDADGIVNKDPLHVEAVNKLIENIILVIAKTLDPENHNLLAVLQMNITTWIKLNESEKEREQQFRKKYENILGKFIKRHGRFNLFHEAIKAQIEFLGKHIQEIQHNIDVGNKMLEITKQYDYQLLLGYGSFNRVM